MLGAIFVASGTKAALNPDQYVDRAKPVTDRLGPLLAQVRPGWPTDTRSMVRLNGLLQAGGGLMLATGRASRPAAGLLAGSLVPATVAAHPFWSMDDPAQRRDQQVHFLKNMGLLGGLMLAAADTRGSPSLAWRARHAARDARRKAHDARRKVRGINMRKIGR